PACHQTATDHFHRGNLDARHHAAVTGPALHDVALQGESARATPVGAKADLLRPPVVRQAHAARTVEIIPLARLAPGAPLQVVAGGGAVPEGGAAFEVAGLGHHQAALGLRGIARDDVDHAVHGVGAPQGGARPADHLDAFD